MFDDGSLESRKPCKNEYLHDKSTEGDGSVYGVIKIQHLFIDFGTRQHVFQIVDATL